MGRMRSTILEWSRGPQDRLLPSCIAALTLVSLLGLPASAQAQSDDWEFVIAPYVLFGSLTGEGALGPVAATPVDLSFGDLVENLQFAAMAHGEVWKGAWGFVGDVVFLSLGSDISLPGARVLDIGVEEVVAEGLLSRRFVRPDRQVDLFAGIRYWDLDLDLQLVDGPGAGLDLGEKWVDPIAGVRLIQDVAEDWLVIVRGDIGGFGVGSDFSWNAQGGVGYEVSNSFSLVAQYKALDVDFENDEAGAAAFLSYDTTTHGPVVGFVFRF